MKRLDLILNGKGGVGKSFFAVNFVQYLKDKEVAHTAIDSDNENSTLNRFHPDSLYLDLADRRGLDAIFNALEKASLVVVDCRAASTDLFVDFFEVIDLSTVLSAMGAALTFIMVRNAAHSDNFSLFEASEVRTQLKDKFGGREIAMGQLQDWLVVALNQENVTVSTAVKHPAFSLLDRQRLQTWQRKLYAEIESAADLLLPTKL